MTILLVQERWTPHNQGLIDALRESGLKVITWYQEAPGGASSSSSGVHVPIAPNFYKHGSLDWKFLRQVLFCRPAIPVIVGWSNRNTRAANLILQALFRNYIYWSDNPTPTNRKLMGLLKWGQRKFALGLLRLSRARVFAVGSSAKEYFLSCGFPPSRVVNVPVPPPRYSGGTGIDVQAQEIMGGAGIEDSAPYLFAGSRLVKEKGFDILLEAYEILDSEISHAPQLVICGSGPEEESLRQFAARLSCEDKVKFVGWQPPEIFCRLVAGAQIFVHPARFDAYGATIIAADLGVPIIGSSGAGSVIDRVKDGITGLIFRNGDSNHLAEQIGKLISDGDLRLSMANNLKADAHNWNSKAVARMFCDGLVGLSRNLTPLPNNR